MWVIAGLLLASPLMYAGSWSGILADSRCYASEFGVSNNYPVYVDGDMNMRIKRCVPNQKTKAFAVVEDDWHALDLDSAGNAKAAELVRQQAKRSLLRVTARGERQKDTIKVDSIVCAK